MDWMHDLNAAMDYIEQNLANDISLDEVARHAACSAFHLQRMFPYLTGTTLADYIRRRRMSMAAMELANTSARVIDVALRYGYDSPTAFARAFKAVQGMSPSEAKRPGAKLVQHPKLSFTLSLKGDVAMDYEIKDMPEFRVVGLLAGNDWTMENAGEKASAFWSQLGASGKLPQVLACQDGSAPQGLLGISFCDDGTFKGYLVGVATSVPCPPELEERIVPAATYAVFDCTGPMPDAMQNLQHRIITEWLPSSDYEWASKADVEVYFGPNMTDPDYKSQVWLPIEKRK